MHEAYRTFSGIRDPVPRPGIDLQAPALGEWRLSHWVTRKVPKMMGCFFFFSFTLQKDTVSVLSHGFSHRTPCSEDTHSGHSLNKEMWTVRRRPPSTRMEQVRAVGGAGAGGGPPSASLMLSFTNTAATTPHRAKANGIFTSRRCTIPSAWSSLWILESEPFNTLSE